MLAGPAVVAVDMNARRAPRVAAVDLLRGVVMVIMALDHVRDYASSAGFDPTDPLRTTPAYFVTRWITHFCAPTFCFLAGTAAFFAGQRRTRPELARWLVTRGLWLVVAEVTIIKFAWSFDIASPTRFLVIWSLGVSMIVLAAAIYLPRWLLAALALAMIAGHNLLDGVASGPLVEFRDGQIHYLHASAFDWAWAILHRQAFPVLYPLIPWIAVMAAGYAFGPLLAGEPAARDRRLWLLGGAITLGFLAVRAINVYGDPVPWQSPHAVMSFFAVSKYPPSLLYLMATLGPAILALPWLERLAPTRVGRFFTVFGRVPFFYYIVHIYTIHLLTLVVSALVTGTAGSGFEDLWVTYAL
jgi:uncharacterized membrane protein